MSRRTTPRPPEWAESLLRRWLPDGLVGLSILGDLRQEFDELTAAGRRSPRLWYARNALRLSGRYAMVRLRASLSERGSMGGWLVDVMTTLLFDVRFGLRMLAKTPVLSAVAVVTIGLGVALTTHTFSTVHGSILRGVPIPGHDRLTYVGENRLDLGIEEMEMSVHDFEDLRRMQTSFEDVAAFYQGTVNVAGDDGPPERFAGAYVSSNALALVGVPPALGRVFLAGEDRAGSPVLIVLGHHVWQNRFGGDPSIVGRSIRVNGRSAEVVGVMPEGFRFPFLEDVWLTHRLDVEALQRGSGPDFDVFGKLEEGVSLAAASAELESIASTLRRTYPEANEGVGMYAQPYTERFMPSAIQSVIWVMLAATFGVLLIACANVTNLLMARASSRSAEVAIRTALGASRWRVVRQLLIESLVIAVLGGVVGVVLAAGGVEAYGNMIADIYRPYWIEFRMDLPVLAFSVGVTALAAVAAGILPAFRATSGRLGEELKDESRGSSSLRLGRLTRALVVTEIAVSCALLVGAGFMVLSIVNLRNVDLGFESEGVLAGRVALFGTEYASADARSRFFTTLKERMEQEPGVTSAAVGTSLPGLGGPKYFLGVEGRAYATDADHPAVTTTVVSSDYFTTLGVSLSSGRDFDGTETRPDGDPVIIVNESFARTYLDGTPVLGERIRLGLSSSTRPWRRVIGVVPDMHIGGNVGGIGDDLERPERVFLPQGALDGSFMSVALRTAGPPEEMVGALRALVTELDPDLPVYDVAPLRRAIDDATWAFGMFGSLFSIFGIAALFLASVGLYGVMAFSVSQRRREMGVRLALGAEPPALVRMVMARGGSQLALGIVIGLALGAGMSRAMRVVLYGVETGDPLVYIAIATTLGLTGLVACLVPARSATRTSPVVAMRGE